MSKRTLLLIKCRRHGWAKLELDGDGAIPMFVLKQAELIANHTENFWIKPPQDGSKVSLPKVFQTNTIGSLTKLAVLAPRIEAGKGVVAFYNVNDDKLWLVAGSSTSTPEALSKAIENLVAASGHLALARECQSAADEHAASKEQQKCEEALIELLTPERLVELYPKHLSLKRPSISKKKVTK